jgi:hypothetical protein
LFCFVLFCFILFFCFVLFVETSRACGRRVRSTPRRLPAHSAQRTCARRPAPRTLATADTTPGIGGASTRIQRRTARVQTRSFDSTGRAASSSRS